MKIWFSAFERMFSLTLTDTRNYIWRRKMSCVLESKGKLNLSKTIRFENLRIVRLPILRFLICTVTESLVRSIFRIASSVAISWRNKHFYCTFSTQNEWRQITVALRCRWYTYGSPVQLFERADCSSNCWILHQFTSKCCACSSCKHNHGFQKWCGQRLWFVRLPFYRTWRQLWRSFRKLGFKPEFCTDPSDRHIQNSSRFILYFRNLSFVPVNNARSDI